ncbi:uncharacterized protein FIBRA_03765 [Fibroporia radiculosa]|uniref:Uncharacterized protein n=1 Tax=Fibroporia radiculosa TaxID=599839 RepID=J4I9T1_9APHY|nr:uncharacterized protein FIBRA_03765 [Fibroporia radiculosa]CCM01701.1 predicted protein [Fibroporia radiculosa]
MDRATRKEDVQKAYELQTRAGVAGAARSTAVGLGLAVLGHYTWPAFRILSLSLSVRISLLKCRISSDAFRLEVTIFGLVIGAENALLSHEAERRRTETALRQEARIGLARRGLVATETEIARWKAEKLTETHTPHTIQTDDEIARSTK